MSAVWLWVGVMWGMTPAGAWESGEGLSPGQVARLRAVTSAEISPEGSAVAYTLAVPRQPFVDEDGPAWQELHAVNAEGQSRGFVTGKVNLTQVAWRPDGRAISFLAKRGDDRETSLYVIPIDGGEARRVLTHETGIRGYDWSPDGRRVAFLATETEAARDRKRREKGFTANIYEEDWRPVRVWVASVTEPAEDWAVQTEQAQPRALELEGSAFAVAWDPRGELLAVAMAPTSLVDDSLMKQRVVLVRVDDAAVVGRVATSGKIGMFRWSPGGEQLALVAAEDEHDPREGRLVMVERRGGAVRDLVPNYEGHIWSMAWRDDRTLVYVGEEGVWNVLNSVAIDGTGRRSLLPVGRHVFGRISLSRDGRTGAVIAQDASHPEEVYGVSLPDGSLRRLTHHNAWLSGVRMASQEPVRYVARDGLELDGILIRPLNEESGRRYPLILSVHGGPEAHESNGWKTSYARPGQVAAARGFAVFYPNYRGSTGRGVDFSKLGQADYAGKEFDDLVDAVRHLVAVGLADERRVGVTGGSYGGYATAWCATRLTEHFAAGVMFVGISDLISKFGTTDIPGEMSLVHARKMPWDDWDFFLERSPIKHAGQSRTPLLILHGKDDPRVHSSQSLELYRYLKTWTETPVRLVLYPGGGHGNARAAARLDYQLRMLQWFEHYLLGAGDDPPPHELEYPFEEQAAE
ncbi:MAG: S9 family peptidase [Verrucomicrobia bacterium]|nr:S9 family peptidase [Verrucomicrobiota bacterium]